jgi:hypothetical protein
MPRTVLATTALPTPAGYASTGLDVTTPAAAADVANGNAAAHNGKTLLIAQNTGGATHHVTVTSASDPYNRVGDIAADAVLAGAVKIYGPFPSNGWKQSTDGNLYFAADDASVKFTIVPLP